MVFRNLEMDTIFGYFKESDELLNTTTLVRNGKMTHDLEKARSLVLIGSLPWQ
jgi:hypothetical protein